MNNVWGKTDCYRKEMILKEFIAERKLLYSLKGSGERRNLIIRIGVPYLVKEGMVDFPVGEGFAGCHVEIDGLDETYPEVYGADTVQALNLASNLEPLLKRLQKKYDFYWASGEPYFDE
jgi:hypothetical protein